MKRESIVGKVEKDHEYYEHKKKYFTLFMQVNFILSPLAGMLYWGWDLLYDSKGAQSTLLLRFSFLFAILGFPLIRYIKNRFLWLLVYPVVILYALTLYMLILQRINGGFVGGMAGFLFFLIVAFAGSLGVPLWVGLIYTVFTTMVPHLLSFIGIASNFDHLFYSIVVWPLSGMVMAFQFLVERNSFLRYATNKALVKLSSTDFLTGVSNRRYFMSVLRDEIARSDRFGYTFALLMVDIDNFKLINDRFGHPTGDYAIRSLVGVIRNNMRSFDILARYGGEEFVIILPGTDLKVGGAIAERIRSAVEDMELESLSGVAFKMTVSIGIAEHGIGVNNETQLIAQSDNALYSAKENGRNKIAFYETGG